MTATFYVGDAIEVMSKLPEKSVDLVLTSPPFLALRSYLPADHPDKALEGGSQATPGEYIDWLVDVVEACARVLAPHGSLVFELGDTYAGSGGGGGDYLEGGWREGQAQFAGSAASMKESNAAHWRQKNAWRANTSADDREPLGGRAKRSGRSSDAWPLAKSLSLIPELFRLTLVYGTNPLTGRQTERWRLRNVVRWVRPNPPVGALGDKWRPATSELMVFCKSAKRYFDLDATREPASTNTHARSQKRDGNWSTLAQNDYANPAGAPPLDWWNIPPGGYEGAHYAVFPPELCIKPIKAMCPLMVCRICGEPMRRITEVSYEPHGDPPTQNSEAKAGSRGQEVDALQQREQNAQAMAFGRATKTSTLVGWTNCCHDNWRRGVVLDPFGGSGTTALVATGHGRDCILIDLDERNYELALQRVGPFILERAG